MTVFKFIFKIRIIILEGYLAMTAKQDFSFKKRIIYPACAMFFVLVMAFFVIALAMGLNVVESETEIVYTYDGSTDKSNTSSTSGEPYAMSLGTLVGIMLYSGSFFALGQIFKTNYSPTSKRFVHFFGTLTSFILFIILMSGTVSNMSAPLFFILVMFYSVLYFSILGIMVLFKKLAKKEGVGKFVGFVEKHVFPVFTGFAVILFALSIYTLISQANVTFKFNEEETFIKDNVVQRVITTIVTPLAPTLQNYLRYSATSAVFFLGYKVFFTRLKNVAKVIFNFLILSAGYFLIWILGLDYFNLIDSHKLVGIVSYLITYVAVLIVAGVYLFVRKRKMEETGDYESQFGTSRRKINK